MDDALKLIATIVCGGGALGVVGLGVLYLTKGAIATAIAQAGNRELERLRGEVAKEVETHKHAFSRELERERREAAVTLEQFKAQLTFEAEVRRQAAAKKVEALMTIAAVTTASVEAVYTLSRDDGPHARQAALNDYGRALRDGLVLFGTELIAEMTAFGGELANGVVARGRSDRGAPDLADVVLRGEAARNKLFDAIRRELQLGTLEKTETKS